MAEVLVKTHLIVTDVHEEYFMNWCGKIIDTKPKIKDGKPIFIVIGTRGRIELNTTDMGRIERAAKVLTEPRGRQSVTTDVSRVYIVEEDDTETLMGILTHSHVKDFAPMYDKIDFE